MTRTIVLLLIFLWTALILLAKPSYAVEDCGFVSKQSRELTEQRRCSRRLSGASLHRYEHLSRLAPGRE